MVAIEVQEHVYPHPWEVVTLAQWSKYPHPLCPQVTTVDVLSRRVEGGALHSRRLFAGPAPLPGWLRGALGGGAEALCVEESVVRPEARRMEMRLRSLAWSDWVEVSELCVLEEAPGDPSRTRLRQEWRCEVKGGWGARLERWARQRFCQTVWRGREAVRSICAELEAVADSGVDTVDRALEGNPQTQ